MIAISNFISKEQRQLIFVVDSVRNITFLNETDVVPEIQDLIKTGDGVSYIVFIWFAKDDGMDEGDATVFFAKNVPIAEGKEFVVFFELTKNSVPSKFVANDDKGMPRIFKSNDEVNLFLSCLPKVEPECTQCFVLELKTGDYTVFPFDSDTGEFSLEDFDKIFKRQ